MGSNFRKEKEVENLSPIKEFEVEDQLYIVIGTHFDILICSCCDETFTSCISVPINDAISNVAI